MSNKGQLKRKRFGMGKLRYTAPAVAAVVTLGTALTHASPAWANTTHTESCNKQICLWYSAGKGSAIWKSNEEIAWSNFSYDCPQHNPCAYDHFVDGTGANTGVRNNAHSVADDGLDGDYLYSLPDTRGYQYTVPQAHETTGILLPDSAGKVMRNNNASYKSSECSVDYDGAYIC